MAALKIIKSGIIGAVSGASIGIVSSIVQAFATTSPVSCVATGTCGFFVSKMICDNNSTKSHYVLPLMTGCSVSMLIRLFGSGLGSTKLFMIGTFVVGYTTFILLHQIIHGAHHNLESRYDRFSLFVMAGIFAGLFGGLITGRIAGALGIATIQTFIFREITQQLVNSRLIMF